MVWIRAVRCFLLAVALGGGGMVAAEDSPGAGAAEPGPAAAAVETDSSRAEAQQRAFPVVSPETMPHPQSPLRRPEAEPAAKASTGIEGQWLDPAWVRGEPADVRRFRAPAVTPPRGANPALQPVSRRPERAAGFDTRLQPELAKRYADAPVVRFVAPADRLTNLFEELSLDDLNRYQFRRNRPETIPVARPESSDADR